MQKMVVFYRSEVPFVPEEAGESIPHIKMCKFSSYAEIKAMIEKNEMDLFEVETDD